MKTTAAAVLLTIVAGLACTREPRPAPRRTMPDDVVAILTVPSYDGTVLRLTSWVESVKPGAGDAVAAAAGDLGVERDGLDLRGTVHVIVLAPAPGLDEPDVLLVAPVRDAARLKAQARADRAVTIAKTWAAIGAPDVVKRASPWALETHVTTAATVTRPTLTLFPGAIHARWSKAIAAALEPDGSAPLAFARDTVLGAFQQTARVELAADLDGDELRADVTLEPRPGTALAELLAAQKPATFAVLASLPVERAFSAMGAHLTFGRSGATIRGLATTFLTTKLDAWGPRAAALLETLWANSTGEYGGVTDAATGVTINAIGVSDAERVRTEVDKLARDVTDVTLRDGVAFAVDALTHDGVGFTVARLTAPEDPDAAITASWSAWNGVFLLAFPDADGAGLRAAIDRSRRPLAADAALTTVIGEARARGDSFLMTFDPLSGQKPPIVVGFGVRDGNGRLHARLPPAQVGIMARMAPPGP